MILRRRKEANPASIKKKRFFPENVVWKYCKSGFCSLLISNRVLVFHYFILDHLVLISTSIVTTTWTRWTVRVISLNMTSLMVCQGGRWPVVIYLLSVKSINSMGFQILKWNLEKGESTEQIKTRTWKRHHFLDIEIGFCWMMQ